MQTSKNHFEAKVIFNDETIRRMFRTEFYTYEGMQRLVWLAVAFALVMLALFVPIPTVVKVLCLLVGCAMFAMPDFLSRVAAEGVIMQRGGAESTVSCRINAGGVDVENGAHIPFDKIDRLVEDDQYFYLFQSRQMAVMIPKGSLLPANPERFAKVLAKETGKGGTIAQLKPIMSTLMCKVGADAVVEHNAKARPYMVCRSGSAGIQRYAQTWCGDNYTSWKSLKYNIPIITGMGLSGQPNEGADIGGFAGPAPTEELFVRWVQQGIFQARFSIHSASNDNTVTEPWMFRGSADLIRDAILLRYRFTPYLYSAEYNASKTGAPIMRALVYDFQDDPNVYEESFEFLFGRDILVANVIEEGAKTRKVYLPAGCKWYDWSDKMRCYEGGQTIEIPVTMASIPMFIREGAVIAMADNQLMTMEGDHTTDLHLIVAPKGTVTTTLYDDDGVTNDFKSGVFRKTTITTTAGERVTMDFTSEGSYEDTVKTVKVEMIAKEKSPFWVTLDGRKIEHFLNRRKFDEAAEGWYYSQTKKAVEVKYANPGKDYNLTVSFEQFDLIGM